MTFKLLNCVKKVTNNPLIQQTVFANGLSEMRYSLARLARESGRGSYSHLDFVVNHRHRDASPKPVWIDHPFGQAHK
jgi:hypothetical protein